MERKRSSKRKERKQKGITLVALVVTIVVLLILAGITIVYVFGDNGIFGQAQDSKIATEQATLLEKMRTKVFEVQFEEVKQGKEVDEFNYLQANNYIDTDGIVNIATLFPQFSTGKGSQEQGDCYYVLDGKLYYTSNKKEEKYLGDLYEGSEGINEIPWVWHIEDDYAYIDGIDVSKLASKYYNQGDRIISYRAFGILVKAGKILEIPETLDGKPVREVSLCAVANFNPGVGIATIHYDGVEKIIVPKGCTVNGRGYGIAHFCDLKEIECDPDTWEVAMKAYGECIEGMCSSLSSPEGSGPCRSFVELD